MYKGYKAIPPTEIHKYNPDAVFISIFNNDTAISFLSRNFFKITGSFKYEKLIEQDYTVLKKDLVKPGSVNLIEEISRANNEVVEKIKLKLQNKNEKLKITFLVRKQ